MEPFLGEIRAFGFNFNPRGWAKCDGQLLPIAQNQALYSLLGTTYGGDGRTTFGLPDLRGRASLHQGQGTGLGNRPIGSRAGQQAVALTSSQIPSHTHTLNALADNPSSGMPAAGILSADTLYTAGPSDTALAAQSIGNTGGNVGHENMQPWLVINWCIALQGTFPSRSISGGNRGFDGGIQD